MTARNESSNTLVRRTLISYLLGTFFFKDKKMNDSKEKATTNNTQTKTCNLHFSQQLVTTRRYQDAFTWLATPCLRQVCCKLSTDLLQVDCQNLLFTGLLQVVTSLKMTNYNETDLTGNRQVCCNLLIKCN